MENESKEIILAPTSLPSDIIREAVKSNADLEQLEKLLDIQLRYEANEARKLYHKDMALFKAESIEIIKDKQVSFSSGGKNVGYTHASLSNVVKTTTPFLSKHNLSASWRTQQNGKIVVTCRITHSGGHFEETSLSADADNSGSKNAIQALGSTISYLERYTYLAITGLAAEDQDDDAIVTTELISDKELHIIRDMLIAKDAKESPLCKFLGIKKLEDMRAEDVGKAKRAIEAKNS